MLRQEDGHEQLSYKRAQEQADEADQPLAANEAWRMQQFRHH
jgi:hypothetical protein